MSNAGDDQNLSSTKSSDVVNASINKSSEFKSGKSVVGGEYINKPSDESKKMGRSEARLSYGQRLVAQALYKSPSFFDDYEVGTPLAKAVALLIDEVYSKGDLERLVSARNDFSRITYSAYNEWLESLLERLRKKIR